MPDAWPAARDLLARSEGSTVMPGPLVVASALLECEIPVRLLAGPVQGGLAPLLAPDRARAAREHLASEGVSLVAADDARRGIDLVRQAARLTPGVAAAWVPATELDHALPTVRRLAASRPPRGHVPLLLLEDDPVHGGTASPGEACRRHGLPCFVPTSLRDLREILDVATRIGRAARRPVALVVHRTLLEAAETLECFPSRSDHAADLALAERRRPRPAVPAESDDLVRLVRRAELNRFEAVPSPGERVPVGYLAVGPAATSLRHVVSELQLHGRVASLVLGALEPLDEVAVSRLLARCEHVVVLEPRPGDVARSALAVAERMRQGRTAEREAPGRVWGSELPRRPTTRATAPEPSEPEDGVEAVAPDEVLHPSFLVRRLLPLLRRSRPGTNVAARLSEPPAWAVPDPPASDDDEVVDGGPGPIVPRRAQVPTDLLDRAALAVDQWLRQRQGEDDDEEPERAWPPGLSVSGWTVQGARSTRPAVFESFDAVRFAREGRAAVRQAARAGQAWVLAVADVDRGDAPDPARLADALVPSDAADRVQVHRVSIADDAVLQEAIREASAHDGLTILVAGLEPARDEDLGEDDAQALAAPLARAARARRAGEVDRLGFEPRQRLVLPMHRICSIRRPVEPLTEVEPEEGGAEPLRTSVRTDRVPGAVAWRPRLRVRPLREQVEVLRVRPPLERWRGGPVATLPAPVPRHGDRAAWRVHLAGVRGEAPGVVAGILATAGESMGFHVGVAWDPASDGVGRARWAAVRFTRPRPGERPRPLVGRVPRGEADLLLGLDVDQALDAVSRDPALMVAERERTAAVVNVGAFSDEDDDETLEATRAALVAALDGVTREPDRLVADVAQACRAHFHSERLVDVVLLGMAFQQGLVPLTVTALEHGLAAMGGIGYARLAEAFRFGRHAVVEPRLLGRGSKDVRAEDPIRLVRRLEALALRRGRRRGRPLATLLRERFEAMPGLLESDAGRQAMRDFLIGTSRCALWGGLEEARRYADLVLGAYRVDRASSGRALARGLALPLASAMLIRDPFYLGALVTSPEHRRRVRQWLNIRRARGDRVERRYLARFELALHDRRLRLDVRFGVWAPRLAARLRPFVPRRLRGTPRERRLRAFLVSLAERIATEAPEHREQWEEIVHRLHRRAEENRLRGTVMSELQMLVDVDDETARVAARGRDGQEAADAS